VTWVTFVPSFVLVLVGAPWVERLRGNASLAAALAGITAAVVGVIANLAVFFALHTLFARTTVLGAGPVSVELPVLTSVRLDAVLVGVVAALLLFRLRLSVLRTLGVCALLGLAISGVRALAG
ncbi:MAG: chromate transporter, partial [Phycicoccus sp.]